MVNLMNDATEAPRVLTHRFGPNWKGNRCGAKTRAGGKCQKPASLGTPRCITHGARAGAPRGPAHGRWKTGKHSIEAVALRRAKVAAARRAKQRVDCLEQMGVLLNLFGDRRKRRRVDERLAALQKRYWSLMD